MSKESEGEGSRGASRFEQFQRPRRGENPARHGALILTKSTGRWSSTAPKCPLEKRLDVRRQSIKGLFAQCLQVMEE